MVRLRTGKDIIFFEVSVYDNSVSVIFAVLSKCVGMNDEHTPHKYLKSMNELVRSNTSEKPQKKVSWGVECHPGT